MGYYIVVISCMEDMCFVFGGVCYGWNRVNVEFNNGCCGNVFLIRV